MFALYLGICALIAGIGGGLLVERFLAKERRALGLPPTSPRWQRRRIVLSGVLLGLLGWALATAEIDFRCLDTPEVRPPEWAWRARTIYHTVLAGFLLAATLIDLDCYVIPDRLTFPGIALGILAAVLVGDMQIAHLWVDWSYAVPQLSGPYIPPWYDQYRRAHALAWTTAGAAAGAGLTLLVRQLSSRVLGKEAMGLGDATLMALIGSFLGWQAVLLTFALAPLTGLLAALLGKLTVNRPYLPYGPCLSAAALLVLFCWGWLWQHTRLMFSDLPGLALLAGLGVAALTVLLLLLRLYRSIPTGR
jgi:leader peptidase (prepilin peptidase)/N-methyltransferase